MTPDPLPPLPPAPSLSGGAPPAQPAAFAVDSSQLSTVYAKF
jgi:hypothetical protein